MTTNTNSEKIDQLVASFETVLSGKSLEAKKDYILTTLENLTRDCDAVYEGFMESRNGEDMLIWAQQFIELCYRTRALEVCTRKIGWRLQKEPLFKRLFLGHWHPLVSVACLFLNGSTPREDAVKEIERSISHLSADNRLRGGFAQLKTDLCRILDNR